MRINAWDEDDTEPCAEVGEHLDTQQHPLEECPTYSDEPGDWRDPDTVAEYRMER